MLQPETGGGGGSMASFPKKRGERDDDCDDNEDDAPLLVHFIAVKKLCDGMLLVSPYKIKAFLKTIIYQ